MSQTRPIGRVAKAIRSGLVMLGMDRAFGPALPAALRPRTENYRAPSVRPARRNGINYELDLSDYVQWLVYYGVEDDQRRELLALARPGDTVIDVGTNIGNILLSFAKAVGPKGRVIGFEANPQTLIACRANVARNSFDNIRLEGVGLGASTGELNFGRPSTANSGADRFMPNGTGTMMVKIIPFDDFVREAALDRIDLIKIDVEGFEFQVLQGAEQSIARFKPRLFIELCHRNLSEQGDSAKAMIKWLEDRGYALCDALTGVPVTSADALDDVFCDIVCTNKG